MPDCALGTPLPILHVGAYSVTVTPDGTQMVLSCSCGSIRVWSMSSGEEALVLEGHAGRVCGVAVTPDGTRVVSCSEDKTVRVWDMHTGEAVFWKAAGQMWQSLPTVLKLSSTSQGGICERSLDGDSRPTLATWLPLDVDGRKSNSDML